MKYLLTDAQGTQTLVISDTSLAQMKTMYSPMMDVQPVPEPEPIAEAKPKKAPK